MKRIITIVLSLFPLFVTAQETQIIGGYLLDGKDSFEELDAAGQPLEKWNCNIGMTVKGCPLH